MKIKTGWRLLILLFFVFAFFVNFRYVTATGCATSCCGSLGCICSFPNCDGCPGCPTNPEIKNPILSDTLSSLSGEQFLQKFLNLGVTLALIVGSLFFFFTLLLGGIRWISSSGDKTQIEGAHKQITNALIGLAILLGTFAIIGLIEFLFGINIIKFTLPTL